MERDLKRLLDRLPRLDLPPEPEPTPQELEERQKLFAETLELRRAIGPIGVSVEELLAYEDDDES